MNKLITFIENKIRNIIEVEIGLVLNKCKKNIKTQFQSKHICCMFCSRVGQICLFLNSSFINTPRYNNFN